jgi:hypothetical protein
MFLEEVNSIYCYKERKEINIKTFKITYKNTSTNIIHTLPESFFS